MALTHGENVTDVREITESDETGMMESRRFTNTALPIFSGTEGWYQHIHIVQAIVKSNGWPEETAALQLFVHLKGEALNVALLLAKEEQESWTGLVDGLEAYYQSPGRLAGLRKRFSDAFRQPGLDPATYATNLGMLAIQGFGDLRGQTRDKLIQDKFIDGQEQMALRRQLEGFSEDTPIGEIVDSCRVWESHSDSNWILRGRYESEVGSRDSRAWEQKEAEGAIERQEREAEREKRVEIVRMLRTVQSSMEAARARERDGALTGGPACSWDRSDGHGVHRRPRVGAVQVQQITTGWPHGTKGRNRVNNKGRKPKKSPGNERRSERGDQPVGPRRIRAPLTLVGAPARIRKGDPRGRHRGTIMGRPNGRPTVVNSHPWEHKGRLERRWDRLVPGTSKWTHDRGATRHRPPEDWTGKGSRLETFGRFQKGTVGFGHEEFRNP